MCTAEPIDNLWLPEATGMDKNGCCMPNGSIFSHFWAIEDLVVVGPHGGNEELEICILVMIILEIKITVFASLLSNEGGEAFPSI